MVKLNDVKFSLTIVMTETPSTYVSTTTIQNVALVTVLLTSLAYVAGLGWNDAIQTLINRVWTRGRDTIVAKFIYAIIVSVIILLLAKGALSLLTRPELQRYVD